MKTFIASALIIAGILACSLLPGELVASWRANRGYPIRGLPVLVAMSPARWSVNFYDNSPKTAGPLLIISVYKP